MIVSDSVFAGPWLEGHGGYFSGDGFNLTMGSDGLSLWGPGEVVVWKNFGGGVGPAVAGVGFNNWGGQ